MHVGRERRFDRYEGFLNWYGRILSCAIGEHMPTLASTEIMEHLEKGDLVEFFTAGDNLFIFEACVRRNIEVEGDYQFRGLFWVTKKDCCCRVCQFDFGRPWDEYYLF